MTIKTHNTFTATATPLTSPEFAEFFKTIGQTGDNGMAYVTTMKNPVEGVFAFGPAELGEYKNKALFEALAEAAYSLSA